MTYQVRRAEYFYTTVTDEPGQALNLLTPLAEGINLLAFTAVPVDPTALNSRLSGRRRQDGERGQEGAAAAGRPYAALLVHGKDALGALAAIHAKLHEANVDVYASSGLADGRGGYGYMIYVKGQDYDASLRALGVP